MVTDHKWLVGDEAWRQAGCVVYMGERKVPRVDHDMGARYLGVNLEGAGRWSELVTLLGGVMLNALTDIGPARIPPSLARYIWRCPASKVKLGGASARNST